MDIINCRNFWLITDYYRAVEEDQVLTLQVNGLRNRMAKDEHRGLVLIAQVG